MFFNPNKINLATHDKASRETLAWVTWKKRHGVLNAAFQLSLLSSAFIFAFHSTPNHSAQRISFLHLEETFRLKSIINLVKS